jgi:predicted glutamine amidotransferase
MCRWLAYSGPAIYLDKVLFEPENSLISQSLNARLGATATNGDGFGVGWYGERGRPGLFRDVLPAWNDDNLRSVSEQISASLFFAHVRASTGTATARYNCHPFRHGPWLFMHNGRVSCYERVRRDIDMLIAPSLYAERVGTTDSEAIFYLMLSNGLDADPVGAIARTVGQIGEVMAAAQVTEPFRFTAAASNGRQIFAVRYSSDGQSPSLFYGRPQVEGADLTCQPQAMILSEPLDAISANWIEVPEGHVLVAEAGRIASILPFTPGAKPRAVDLRASA